LQLHPAGSVDQIEDIRSGRVDAGFVFNMRRNDEELDQLPVAMQHVELAAPEGHPLSKLRKPRLRDPVDVPFVWFPRREGPAFYDRLMHECYRGGLKSLRSIQEAANEATILSLVSHGMGAGWVNETARWLCPERVVILSITDPNMPLPTAFAWRKDNTSPFLARFIADVQRFPDVQALSKK
jgi:DNA-binding transcriptional LysR family regulator